MSLSSCAVVPTNAGVGFVYTDMQDGAMVTSNTVGNKVGRAKATNVLGIVVQGDASVNAAAKSAGITKISHVDFHKTNILGVFGTCEIVVYGE